MSWKANHGQQMLEKHGWMVQRQSRVHLSGARVIDPEQELDEKLDLLVERGRIVRLGEVDRADLTDVHTLDLRGKIVAPGLFDMHVHLREPGREDKETITTGIGAAVAGGFTGIACMPNTDPPLDNVGVVRWVMDQAAGAPVDVHPVAAVTRDREGKRLTDLLDLHDEGVRAVSDDGSPVAGAETMRRALEYCKTRDMVISTHSEESNLAQNGVMREGEVATRLGLAGWPSVAESVMVARDLLLAMHTGGRLHIGHISSAESIALVRWAKEMGARVTCEATPHHIALTDQACESFSGNYKMNPPLGSQRDQQAVIEGLRDGTIDAIATDHAPHTVEESMKEFSLTPNGVIGMETALGVVAKELVKKEGMDWPHIIRLMSTAPRTILKLAPAAIREKQPAQLVIIDPDATWMVQPEKFLSKGRNTPFGGWQLPAKPLGLLHNGQLALAPDARMLWQ